MKTVVAALIEDCGRLLVCQRKRGDRFALQWEFPGGKVEPGETPQAALARELREELGSGAEIGPEIFRTRHAYKEMPEGIELIFFAARVPLAEIKNLDFEQIEWRALEKLPELDFLAADRELIARLASGSLALPPAGAWPAARKNG
jgi:8-oxo-dGTP diphosphatase